MTTRSGRGATGVDAGEEVAVVAEEPLDRLAGELVFGVTIQTKLSSIRAASGRRWTSAMRAAGQVGGDEGADRQELVGFSKGSAISAIT